MCAQLDVNTDYIWDAASCVMRKNWNTTWQCLNKLETEINNLRPHFDDKNVCNNLASSIFSGINDLRWNYLDKVTRACEELKSRAENASIVFGVCEEQIKNAYVEEQTSTRTEQDKLRDAGIGFLFGGVAGAYIGYNREEIGEKIEKGYSRYIEGGIKFTIQGEISALAKGQIEPFSSWMITNRDEITDWTYDRMVDFALGGCLGGADTVAEFALTMLPSMVLDGGELFVNINCDENVQNTYSVITNLYAWGSIAAGGVEAYREGITVLEGLSSGIDVVRAANDTNDISAQNPVFQNQGMYKSSALPQSYQKSQSRDASGVSEDDKLYYKFGARFDGE